MESVHWIRNEVPEHILTHWNLPTNYPRTGTPGRRSDADPLIRSWWIERVGHEFPDSQQVWIIHCAIMLPWIALGEAVTNLSGEIFWVNDNETTQIRLYYNGTNKSFEIYRGIFMIGTTSFGSAETLLENIWNHLIFKILIDNSKGAYQIVWNGVLIGSGGCLNTQVTENANANRIYLANPEATGYFDEDAKFHDIYICDGQGPTPYNGIIGDIIVRGVSPNGVGANSNWVPIGFSGSGSENWAKVDDRPILTFNYNMSWELGAIDTYAVPDLTLDGICCGVEVHPITQIDSASETGIARAKLLVNETLYDGNNYDLTTTYTSLSTPWAKNPNTNREFTEADLAGLEPGIETVAMSGANTRIAQMVLDYAEVASLPVVTPRIFTYCDEAQSFDVVAE